MEPNSFFEEIVPVIDFKLIERMYFSLKKGVSENRFPFSLFNICADKFNSEKQINKQKILIIFLLLMHLQHYQFLKCKNFHCK